MFSKSFFSIRAGQFDERGKEIGVYACSHCDANVYRLLESAQQLDLDVSGTYVTIFYKPGTSRREQRRVLRPQNRRVSQRSGWNYHTVWDTGNILDLDYGTNPRWPRKTSFILKMFGLSLGDTETREILVMRVPAETYFHDYQTENRKVLNYYLTREGEENYPPITLEQYLSLRN